MSINFADAGKVPYTQEQVVTTAYDLIFLMVYFNDACHRWNQNSAVDKTWTAFKRYFPEEHRLWHDTHPTSAGVTYPSSNALV